MLGKRGGAGRGVFGYMCTCEGGRRNLRYVCVCVGGWVGGGKTG